MSYKKKKAYQPKIATIGRHIVYLENRNGNSPAKFQQAETPKKCYEKLKENVIKIGISRMNSASYQKDVIEKQYKPFFFILIMKKKFKK